METCDDVLLDADDKMAKAVEYLHHKFTGLRTGKASPNLVENVTVEYYGAPTRLRDLAGISTPEPRLLVINAFDPSCLPAIEKAILAANLGVTPMNDGRLIRIPIPELSEERRKELVKVAKREAEDQRVAVRNVRREANDRLKAMNKSKEITDDDRDQGLDGIQKSTDEYIKKIDAMLAAKEKEVMVV
ncbi:MAG: ribosome recycling factor [Spartobacteria bacterium]|nr:ribosome recycling factor [Spartobacteria bacterium]